MLIDTHAHLNFNAYKDDSDKVAKRSLAGDVWMINVGSQYSTSERAVRMAGKYPEGVYAAVGLHPIHLETGLVKIKEDKEEIKFETREETFDCKKYKELALSSKKVVAIGEIGLDYYWKPKSEAKLELFREKQRTVFLNQLNLAKELNLPVILHCRVAHEELLNILNSGIKGVVHCFTGNWEQADKYLAMGFYLGFNGIIFKLNLDEIIKRAPLERILLETDCPYLTPPQESGRNEPLFIKHIAQKIADIKGIGYDAVVDAATNNAKNLFSI